VRAAWYTANGPASSVLHVGQLAADPEPRSGEVRVRMHAAGVGPADAKRRSAQFESAPTACCASRATTGFLARGA